MRKLRMQMQITIDGCVARPDGGNDWIVAIGNDEATKLVVELTDPADTIIMGRKMSIDFTKYWEAIADGDRNHREYALAKRMVEMQKIIFTKTLKSTKGRNARVENGDLKTEVMKLKDRPGKDIIVYGGATFVASLIKENLIDEYCLFINPVAIGDGMRIFFGTNRMELVSSTQLSCGIVVARYKPFQK